MGATLVWSGSFVFVGYIVVCRFHLGSLVGRALGLVGSLERTLRVVGFILVRLVHTGAPLVSSGSSVFVWFILARPGGGRVHSCSLGSFRLVLGVVGFIRIGWVHAGAS